MKLLWALTRMTPERNLRDYVKLIRDDGEREVKAGHASSRPRQKEADVPVITRKERDNQ